jgi:hypothetical protein
LSQIHIEFLLTHTLPPPCFTQRLGLLQAAEQAVRVPRPQAMPPTVPNRAQVRAIAGAAPSPIWQTSLQLMLSPCSVVSTFSSCSSSLIDSSGSVLESSGSSMAPMHPGSGRRKRPSSNRP